MIIELTPPPPQKKGQLFLQEFTTVWKRLNELCKKKKQPGWTF